MSFILPLLELRCKDTLGKGNTIIVNEGRLVGINENNPNNPNNPNINMITISFLMYAMHSHTNSKQSRIRKETR